MVKKASLFIVDASATYLDSQRGTLRALDSYSSVIQVLAPFDADTVVSLTYLVYGANNETVTQYMSATTFTGADVLESTHALYQDCVDWIVWEISVSSRALAKISKYKQGQVGIAFSFKERFVPASAVTYVSTFGLYNDLPASSTTGYYYICDKYNYTSAVASLTFTKTDVAVWNGTAWVKPDQYTLIANTTTYTMSVSPSMTEAIATTLDADTEFQLIFTEMQADINNMIDGTQVVAEATKATNDGDDNVITTTYETKTDATTHKARTTVLEGKMDTAQTDIDAAKANIVLLENANMIKSASWNGTTFIITFTHFDTTTSTVTISLAELKAFIGEATNALSGLMSATHVTNLETLMALFDADGDAVVDTLAEVLAIFAAYPEGVDLVTALAAKVDKVTGKSLVDDDEITHLEALDTQAETDAKFDDKVDKDISAYTALVASTAAGTEEIYIFDNGVAKKIILTEIYAGANTATGSFVASSDYVGDGLGAYKTAMVSVHTLTAVTNGDFKISLKTQASGMILYVIIPTTTSTSALRVSTDNGTTYYNVLKNGATMRASVVSGQLVRLQFDGTNFIADIQGDVGIEEEYTEKLNSTYGLFAPQDNGIPMVKEISGRTIPALTNLVTNGDFASGTTGWSASFSANTEVGGNLINTGSGSGVSPFARQYPLVIGQVYYLIARVRVTNSLSTQIYVNDGYTTTAIQNTPVINTWYRLTGGKIAQATQYVIGHSYANTTDATGAVMEIDYAMSFNLTALFGVTATSGTAYDNAVADIEAMLEANSGYISTTSTTHVENSQFKTVGKNLFDETTLVSGTIISTGVEQSSSDRLRGGIISVLSSTAYTYKSFALVGAENLIIHRITQYDINQVFTSQIVPNFTNPDTFTVGSTTKYIKITFQTPTSAVITAQQGKDANIQLEQGTVATTYAPYNSETQLFNHERLSKLPNDVADLIRYDNGAYVLDRYVQEYTLLSGDIDAVTTGTNLQYVTIGIGALTGLITQTASAIDSEMRVTGFIEVATIDGVGNTLTFVTDTTNLYLQVTLGTYADLAAAQTALAGTVIHYQLATPLLATEVIDVDGTLIQETVTTLEQLQTIPTTLNIEYAMNVEQTAKTLVQRDKVQQLEIDNNEARLTTAETDIVTLEARKTTTNDIIIMSATAWTTYTEVTGEVYGVYDEATFVITFYYGQTA